MLSKRKPNEAEAEYRELIRLDPKSTSGYQLLGDLLEFEGKPDEAAAEFRELIRLDPKSSMGHEMLGDLLMGQHKLARIMRGRLTSIA